MVSDKKIHRAFRTRTTELYKQNPLEKFFIFTIYQNYTLALRDRQITDLLTLKMSNDDTQICNELKINEILM